MINDKEHANRIFSHIADELTDAGDFFEFEEIHPDTYEMMKRSQSPKTLLRVIVHELHRQMGHIDLPPTN